MNKDDLEQLEVDLLLEAMYRVYGYDFRKYARASVNRRIRLFCANNNFNSPSELIPRVLYDKQFFWHLAQHFSVCVTEMFRDPFVYKALREKVLPRLHSYPSFKIWHAGCASGEEVYSMAILLKEEDLLSRATLFGTDFSREALAQCRQGVYPLENMKEYSRNYQQAGCMGSLADYYHARYNGAVINKELKSRITFAGHNLTTDGVFGETHLVFGRNLLIYFNKELQNRVLNLFTQSLVHGGFLCLGTAESIKFTEVAGRYQIVDQEARIYKKVR